MTINHARCKSSPAYPARKKKLRHGQGPVANHLSTRVRRACFCEKSAQRAQSRSRQACSGDAMKSTIRRFFFPTGADLHGSPCRVRWWRWQSTNSHSFFCQCSRKCYCCTTFNFTVTALDAACKPDDGDNQMKEKDEDIAHPGVVSKPEKTTNFGGGFYRSTQHQLDV